jgi:DNA helicase-2/ATP-dependent DNA helicase PcrA
VACTRAKEYLGIFVPDAIYDRNSGGRTPARPSPFVRELAPDLYEEWRESYAGRLTRRDGRFCAAPPALSPASSAPELAPPPGQGEASASGQAPGGYGYCTHKIFGRGKIVKFLPPDKYQVNFPGLGLKVIMGAFLRLDG